MADRIGSTSSHFAPAGRYDGQNAASTPNRRSTAPEEQEWADRFPSQRERRVDAFGQPLPPPELAKYGERARLQLSTSQASTPEAKATYYQHFEGVKGPEPTAFPNPTEAQEKLHRNDASGDEHAVEALARDLAKLQIRAEGATFPTFQAGSSARSLLELAEAHHRGDQLEKSLLSHLSLTFVLRYINAQPEKERPALASQLADDVIAEAKRAEAENKHNIPPTLYNLMKALLDFDLDSAENDPTIEGAMYRVHEYGRTVGAVAETVPFVRPDRDRLSSREEALLAFNVGR